MKALRIHAGPVARLHLEHNGLSPADVGVIPAAAGGPKGLILGPLDRFLFGEWLPQSSQPVHLVGGSIGAWRMATACLDGPVSAFERLEHDYIHQSYEVPAGKKRPPASHVSARFGQNLEAFFGGRVGEILRHPRYRLHIVTSRGRRLLAREHPVATPLGYLAAFMSNSVHRKALAWWLERVVFSSGPGARLDLPFATRDFATHQVPLGEHNFMQALCASCSIPFVLQAVHDIPGAPPGAYWDGGITDYHLHLDYAGHSLDKSKTIAEGPLNTRAGGHNGVNDWPGREAGRARAGAGIVLYPHFQHQVVPGWLDKGLKWRHAATPALDNMVLLSPSPQWVQRLPRNKLPDRQDFTHFGMDSAARAKAWLAATRASQQLVEEWREWLRRPDMAVVHPL